MTLCFPTCPILGGRVDGIVKIKGKYCLVEFKGLLKNPKIDLVLPLIQNPPYLL